MIHADDPVLESALTHAMAFHPDADTLARMDARASEGISTLPMGRRRFLPSLPRLTSRTGLIALLVGALLVAAAGGSTLLNRVARSEDGLSIAFSRGVGLGPSQTVNGLTLGVAAAYMDSTQILIFLSGDWATVGDETLTVNGTEVRGGVVRYNEARGQSVAVLRFLTPPGVGSGADLALVIPEVFVPPNDANATPSPDAMSSPDAVPDPDPLHGNAFTGTAVRGPWHFEGHVPNAGGSTWTGNASATDAGVTITIKELRISPTTVYGRLYLSGPGLRGHENWDAGCDHLVHGDAEVRVSGGGVPLGQAIDLHSTVGFDDFHGVFRCRTDWIIGMGETFDARTQKWAPDVQLHGRWVIDITIP